MAMISDAQALNRHGPVKLPGELLQPAIYGSGIHEAVRARQARDDKTPGKPL
jgi:hypothetical protein